MMKKLLVVLAVLACGSLFYACNKDCDWAEDEWECDDCCEPCNGDWDSDDDSCTCRGGSCMD
jgi:hypothetical protein